jgi:hypothetical protein
MVSSFSIDPFEANIEVEEFISIEDSGQIVEGMGLSHKDYGRVDWKVQLGKVTLWYWV